MYQDLHGLIIQKNGDGGDSLQRHGFNALAEYILNSEDFKQKTLIRYDFIMKIEAFYSVNDFYCRYPFQDWTSHPEITSRDQLTPNVILSNLLEIKYDKFINNVKGRLLRHFGFYGNTLTLKNNQLAPNRFQDVASPEHWSHVLNRPFWLRHLGDLFMLLNSFLRVHADKYDVDDNNHLASLAHAKLVKPTLISNLAFSYYYRNRDWAGALREYHREESGGNPELAEKWIKVIEKVNTI